MTETRKPNVKHRNVRLKIETYEMLDKYLIELMSEKEKRLTLNNAVAYLLDEHYKHKKNEEEDSF